MAIRERPVKPVSGGSGSAGQAAVATLPRAASGRGGIAALLEDERVLGVMLLLPTIVLLTLFIAYPFVKGVWLSLTSATVGNPGLHLATWVGGFPGVSTVMTKYMNHKMEELDIPSIPEFIDMIADTGASLYACKASVDLFGLEKNDFIPQVQDIITVGEFYEQAAGGQIIFT